MGIQRAFKTSGLGLVILLAVGSEPVSGSDLALRQDVPLAETPTSLRLLEYARPARSPDATITFVNQSDWRIDVIGGQSEPIVESQATMTVDCNGLGQVIHIVITASDGRSQSVGIPKRCGSEILLIEAKPLSHVASPARKEASR